ncbi:MAG TPA: cbb3-type cytochrome oxidase assembly protein CcoS [Burkholderiaceae bacterium]|jgi:cbb3-type cytochrome oxidase maturation protein
MDILYLLIPLTAALVLGILGVFAWALHGGQFDDLEQHGAQIFLPDSGAFDPHQPGRRRAIEESTVATQPNDGAP